MADAAISFAVQKLGNLLIQKVGFLKGVEGQVQWLRDELERMQCFLKDAADKQADDERIRKWISEIREVAQDADDIIEIFILRVDTPRRSRSGLLGLTGAEIQSRLHPWLGRCTCFLACFPNHVYFLGKVGKEIESIRKRLQHIDTSRERYGIVNVGAGTVSSRRSESRRRLLPPWQKDKHMVGLEEDVQLLLDKAILEERTEGLCTAGIMGMGGLGKSTLARLVYNHIAVVYRFDCRAWVAVSREFNPKEIIKDLIFQLLDPREDKLKVLETMEKLGLQRLQKMLHDRLKDRRYFIVLDDVWENEHWETLSSAFPDDDNASRLLFTSRSRNVPTYAQYVHEMKILDAKKSWELFLKKAFNNNIDGKCPQELENIGQEILRKCNGLPLAITVVGGLLAKQRPLKSEWEKILKGTNSNFGTSGNSVSAILELSYHSLPPQLRSCFLCLGFFKEDATIRAEKLLQVWIAEGLVSHGGEEETMEMARSCLDELVNRNMIQVKDLSMDSRVKTCQIHDLLRELSITKAKEEISFEILGEEGSSPSSNKPRHRAIYYSSGGRFFYSKKSNKRIRSLFFHGSGNIDIRPTHWKSFELLRVLDFEDFGLKCLPDIIGALIGLRYLGLRNNNIHELPSSLGCLKKLEVLDIAWNIKVKVPNVIWKMDNLRHLYMSEIICEVALKMDTLKNLRTLAYIPAAHWMHEHGHEYEYKHAIQMTSLRKLGITIDGDADVIKLCTSLTMLKNLLHLNLAWSYDHRTNISLDRLRSLQRLTQLKLRGCLTSLPSASSFPPNLTYLSLVDSWLATDPMPVLEKLPKLLYLKLNEAYSGNKLVIFDYGFPRLKVLSLRGLHGLRIMGVGKGAMPELQRLEIYRCPKLERESLPEKLRSVSNLQN